MIGELWRRVWYVLNRSRFERELRDEMDAHRAMRSADSPRFGNELRLREEAADQWGWAWLDRLRQDMRFGTRLLVRAPLFSLTAILVLALGVGVNLAAFQVLDAVAFSALPVPAPDTLVKLTRRHPGGTSTSFSYPAFAFYRSAGGPLASTYALSYGSVTLGDDRSRRVDVEFVTGNYFTELAARAAAGRLLLPADDRAEAPAVVVLSERLWRARFGADPALVGKAIAVNGHSFVVAGVVSDSFIGFNDAAQAWAPIAHHRIAFPGSTLLSDDTDKGAIRVYARLRDGVSIEQAEAALLPAARALRDAHPNAAAQDEWVHLTPAGRYLPLDASSAAGVALVGALVLLLLVTACMNLGLLVLSRTLSRDREFAVRLSVGASRGRILRQLVTEQALLAAAGGAAGCLVAAWAVRLFAAATRMPAGLAPHMTVRSAAAAVALAALSAFLFGFAPALQSMRPSVTRRLRARTVLIGVQVAAAMILTVVSALLVRGVTRVTSVPLGFEYQQALFLDPDLTSHGLNPDAAAAYWLALEQRVTQMPGVESTAIATLPPFGNRVSMNREGTVFYGVTPSYFQTMGIPLVRGRLFGPREAGASVVSETLARRKWPGEDPIGKPYNDGTVVGVVGDARSVRLGDGSATESYYPVPSAELPGAVLIVRTTGEPRSVAGPLMAIARAHDASVLPSVVLLPDALDDKLSTARQVAAIASVLGVSALLLAVIGLGGIVAFTVTQRLREIGVRLALGARPRHVCEAVARQFARPVAVGAVAGSALAAGVGFILSRELFGVSPFDPVAHGGALLLFAAVAAMAAAPSVRRALRVDPMTTLRHE